MESAIPQHLQCPRTRQCRVSDDFIPPYPSIVARFVPTISQVVMAYFGVQYREAPASKRARKALNDLGGAFGSERGPGSWDRATYVDDAGFTNVISVGYWSDPNDFDVWFRSHGADWVSGTGAHDTGAFAEILKPGVRRFETLFSSDTPEGVGCLAAGFSDVIQEHAYWGGVRDRIAMSQTDTMEPSGAPRVVGDGVHLRVIPHDNLCLIRSGQDWSATDAEERRMYLDEVEPVLRAGMDYLRDDGLEIGCYANRYMTVVDSQGRPSEKSYGMSWWRSLSALERWAESHPTHVAIFGVAMKYFSTLGPAVRLKLYHEVTVVAASEQHFEYYNCHPTTGILRADTLPN